MANPVNQITQMLAAMNIPMHRPQQRAVFQMPAQFQMLPQFQMPQQVQVQVPQVQVPQVQVPQVRFVPQIQAPQVHVPQAQPQPQIPQATPKIQMPTQGLKCHCGQLADPNVNNHSFCSYACRKHATNNCRGAGIILLHRYNGKEICFIVGHDKNRQGNHGLEAFGGKIDAGETPWDAAIRETREESGINLDAAKLKIHLSTAPIHVKAFRAKVSGKMRFYFTYIVHITSMSTDKMEQAQISRCRNGSPAACVEMDKFYHIRIGSGGFWKNHKDTRIGAAAGKVMICKRDFSVMNDCAHFFSWVVDTPSLNSLGIVGANTYLC